MTTKSRAFDAWESFYLPPPNWSPATLISSMMRDAWAAGIEYAAGMCPRCKGTGEGYEDDDTGQTECAMCRGTGEAPEVPV